MYVTSTPAYAIATVHLDIIGIPSSSFYFVYSKGFHVNAIEPPNAYIPLGYGQDTTVLVNGVNFLPIYGQLFCKLKFTPELIVPATYLNNHTLSCDLPPPPSTVTLPFSLVIEVSQNNGIQYSTDNIAFIYRPLDTMTSLDPVSGFVSGNTLLTIGYGYFYDVDSHRAVCVFEYGTRQMVTRVIAVDGVNKRI